MTLQGKYNDLYEKYTTGHDNFYKIIYQLAMT